MASNINQVTTSHVSGPALTPSKETNNKLDSVTDGNSQAIANNQGDTVSITASAAKLAELETQLANMPIVDEQRVARIKAAVENGSYQVDAEKTASNLLQFEAELSK